MDPDSGPAPTSWTPWLQSLPKNNRTPGISRFPASTPTLWSHLLTFVWKLLQNRALQEYIATARGNIPIAGGTHSLQFVKMARSLSSGLALSEMGIGPLEKLRFDVVVDFAIEQHHQAYFVRPSPVHLPDEILHPAIMFNIGMALLLGMLDCDVLLKGFDEIDGLEWTDWMRRYGAWEVSLMSGLVRAFYDYVFGYSGRDPYYRGDNRAVRRRRRYQGAYAASLHL